MILLEIQERSCTGLQVPLSNGAAVPFGSVSDEFVSSVPNEITRENGSCRIDMTANVRGRDLGAVARDVQARLSAVSFERGYYAEVLGEYAERRASTNRLLLLALVSLAGIALICWAPGPRPRRFSPNGTCSTRGSFMRGLREIPTSTTIRKGSLPELRLFARTGSRAAFRSAS